MKTRSLRWYGRNSRIFLETVQGSTPEVIGAFAVLFDLLASRGWRIKRDDRHLSGVLGCSSRKARSLTDKAIAEELLREENGLLLVGPAAEGIEDGRDKPSTALSSEARQTSVCKSNDSSIGSAKIPGNGGKIELNGEETQLETTFNHEGSAGELPPKAGSNGAENGGPRHENNGLDQSTHIANKAPEEEESRERKRPPPIVQTIEPDEAPVARLEKSTTAFNRALDRATGLAIEKKPSLSSTEKHNVRSLLRAAGLVTNDGELRYTSKDVKIVVEWFHEGHDVEWLKAVVEQTLATKPDMGPPNSMAYFSKAIQRSAAKGSLKRPTFDTSGRVHESTPDFDAKMALKKMRAGESIGDSWLTERGRQEIVQHTGATEEEVEDLFNRYRRMT